MATNQTQRKPIDHNRLAHFYLSAKEAVIEAGYADEIDWQEYVMSVEWNEEIFLREAAWVVLSSGFRESVIRRCFPGITTAFLEWSSAKKIIEHEAACRSNALRVFGNRRKIDAIIEIIRRVANDGIESIRVSIHREGTSFIREFPWMGPVTACHLAKNLGVPIVKPDRHLVRVASLAGYSSAEAMCNIIADVVGDAVSVIDVVIWRYATIANSKINKLPVDLLM